MTGTPIAVREGYRIWSATYESAPNPLLSLVDRCLDVGDTSGLRVIDVGCGSRPRCGAIGADFSGEMLARAAGRVVQADALRLPFGHGVADLVLCILALGYIQPVKKVMRELRRITRPGGRILACDLHPKAMEAGWKRSFESGGVVYEVEQHPYSFYDLSIGGLTLESARELHFGEPERVLYERAGRLDLYAQVRDTPAIWIRQWRV